MPQLRCPQCGTIYDGHTAQATGYLCPLDGEGLIAITAYHATSAPSRRPGGSSESVDELEVVGDDEDVDDLEVVGDEAVPYYAHPNAPSYAEPVDAEPVDAEPVMIDPMPLPTHPMPTAPLSVQPMHPVPTGPPPPPPPGRSPSGYRPPDPVPETPAIWNHGSSSSRRDQWDSSSQMGPTDGRPRGSASGTPSKPNYRVPPPVSRLGQSPPAPSAVFGGAANSGGGGAKPREESENIMPPVSKIPGMQEEIPIGPFGEFLIRRELGRGAMGIVYLADWPARNMRVAFKVLAMKKTEEPRHRKRFMREAQICLNLDHPNLVKVYQVGEHEARCYMAMELIEGRPLSALIAEHGTLDPEEVIPYLIQTLGGCDVFHQAGIIHRDIKPDNMLIRNDGVAKLTDFGLARLVGPDISKLTAAGKAVGTPYFMAPEQILHPDEVDHRVDIYAYGVSLYYALSGAYPYEGRKPNDVLLNIARQQPIHIWTRRPDVPQSVALVTMKLLAREPAQRFTTASEAAAALTQALHQM